MFGWLKKKEKKKSLNQILRESPEMAKAKRICRAKNIERYGKLTCEKCGAGPDHLLPWKQRDCHVAHWFALSRFPAFATYGWNLLILCDHHNWAQKTMTGLPWHWINALPLIRFIIHPVGRVTMWVKTGVW